jgi:hypothetical protein
MGYKKKSSSDKVPPEIILALKFGKSAYERPEALPDDPDQDLCMSVFLICGKLIRGGGLELWQAHRSDLMRRSDVKTWWAFKEFEKRA